MSGLMLTITAPGARTTFTIHGIDQYGVEHEELMSIPIEWASQHMYSKLTATPARKRKRTWPFARIYRQRVRNVKARKRKCRQRRSAQRRRKGG